MKKIIALLLAAVCAFAFSSCKGNKAEETTTEAVSEAVSAEGVSGEEAGENTSENFETSTAGSAENEKETEKSSGEKMTMEVYSDSMSFRVEKSEKVGEVYKMLSALTYEKAATEPEMGGGIGVYFYDKDGKDLESFYIKDTFLKLNGQPETYKITNSDFDYKTFRHELLEAAGNDLGLD